VVPKPQIHAHTPAAPGARPYDSLNVDVKPSLLKQVPPSYPPEAKRRKIEDTVVLRLLISEEGSVREVTFLRRAKKDPAFNDAAVSAVRRWTFSPAQKKGRRVACWFNVAVPFQLKR
jgi:protein TonB